jgi:hypothetical protein
MIVAQQTTEPFTTSDDANGTASAVVISRREPVRRYRPVAQPLMRSLRMIVHHVLGHECAQIATRIDMHTVMLVRI